LEVYFGVLSQSFGMNSSNLMLMAEV
jgi:hypothetical protein